MTTDKIEELKTVLNGEVSDTDMVDFVSALIRLIENRKGAIKRIDTSTRDGMREYLLARYDEVRNINTISHSASSVYSILVLMGQIARVAYPNVDDPLERMKSYAEKYLSAYVKPDVVKEFFARVMCLTACAAEGDILGITHGLVTERGLEFQSSTNNVICTTVEQLLGTIKNSITSLLPNGDDEPMRAYGLTIQAINRMAFDDGLNGFVESNAISVIF